MRRDVEVRWRGVLESLGQKVFLNWTNVDECLIKFWRRFLSNHHDVKSFANLFQRFSC